MGGGSPARTSARARARVRACVDVGAALSRLQRDPAVQDLEEERTRARQLAVAELRSPEVKRLLTDETRRTVSTRARGGIVVGGCGACVSTTSLVRGQRRWRRRPCHPAPSPMRRRLRSCRSPSPPPLPTPSLRRRRSYFSPPSPPPRTLSLRRRRSCHSPPPPPPPPAREQLLFNEDMPGLDPRLGGPGKREVRRQVERAFVEDCVQQAEQRVRARWCGAGWGR